MDPYLQRYMARRQAGVIEAATSSTAADEIAVIARVADVESWEGLSEVGIGAKLGEIGSETIVTARIPIRRIAEVRQQPFVKSLKAARTLRPMLHASTQETLARPQDLPSQAQGQGGYNVVVGIVDYGCDFAHENFLDDEGNTRLISIWDQGGQKEPQSPFEYGKEYSAQDINAALATQDPYSALGYAPGRDTPRRKGTHGTHVMDIAAGNGRGSGTPGIAPNSDLVFVHVDTSDVPREGPDVVGQNFGNSVHLLEAVRYIFDKAGDRPCVVNISLGTNGGPHDGSTPVEQGLDSLMEGRPNSAIVIAAGNAYADGIHAMGEAEPSGTRLALVTPFPNWSHDELEIWYPGGGTSITMEIIAPDGSPIGSIAPGQEIEVMDGNTPVLFAASRQNDPNNSDNSIGVFLESSLPSGAWAFDLYGSAASAVAVPFHAWIERDDLSPSEFLTFRDDTYTIGSVSCGKKTIVVGSYDAHKTSKPLSWFSSAGPTRDARKKPELSAPGHAVWAAHSRTGSAVVQKSGTSMAAPAVSGIIALVLAEAHARHKSLSIDDIREIVMRSVRSSPPDSDEWDPRYGLGRIDAAAAVQAAIDL